MAMDGGLTTDGPEAPLTTADLLVFWATVPGYSAIRDKNNGSWFIQSLCDSIVNQSDK